MYLVGGFDNKEEKKQEIICFCVKEEFMVCAVAIFFLLMGKFVQLYVRCWLFWEHTIYVESSVIDV